MTINKQLENNKLTISVSGRLDTVTAPELEKIAKESINNINELVIDFKELEYISSAGLRVVLMMQKTMSKFGTMVIKNANTMVKEVFEITGFSDILNIE